MKRFGYVALLMVLSSSAYAGGSYSFVFRGHRIHLEAPRHCRSLSCVSVYETRHGRDRYDDPDGAPDAASARPLAAAPAQPLVSPPAQAQAPAPAPVQSRAPVQLAASPPVPPASKPSVQPVVCASPPPATVALSASATKQVAAPPPPKIQQSEIPAMTAPVAAPPATASPATASVEKPLAAAPPPAVAAPQVLKVSRDAADEPEQTPLGDWQTEGNKGSVRIEQCGRALCGYILNPSSNTVSETVLIDMKPKAAWQWSGNIFSRDSGNSYYATMKMNGPNSLRVEACALGPFFCTGNLWSRIGAEPDTLITTRQISSAPRS
jgi:uncharacterized protein (DUF2147 family)